MAENETLDLWSRHSRRWQQLLRMIENDKPVDDLADETVRCLYKTFKNLVELLPWDELLEATGVGPDQVRKVLRRCRKARDYAELVAQQAAIDPRPAQSIIQRAEIIEGVARATVEKFFHQIQMKVVGAANWPDIARFHILRGEIMALIQERVAGLARQVADHPNEKPRMPRRSAKQKAQDHSDLLRLSLR